MSDVNYKTVVILHSELLILPVLLSLFLCTLANGEYGDDHDEWSGEWFNTGVHVLHTTTEISTAAEDSDVVVNCDWPLNTASTLFIIFGSMLISCMLVFVVYFFLTKNDRQKILKYKRYCKQYRADDNVTTEPETQSKKNETRRSERLHESPSTDSRIFLNEIYQPEHTHKDPRQHYQDNERRNHRSSPGHTPFRHAIDPTTSEHLYQSLPQSADRRDEQYQEEILAGNIGPSEYATHSRGTNHARRNYRRSPGHTPFRRAMDPTASYRPEQRQRLYQSAPGSADRRDEQYHEEIIAGNLFPSEYARHSRGTNRNHRPTARYRREPRQRLFQPTPGYVDWRDEQYEEQIAGIDLSSECSTPTNRSKQRITPTGKVLTPSDFYASNPPAASSPEITSDQSDKHKKQKRKITSKKVKKAARLKQSKK